MKRCLIAIFLIIPLLSHADGLPVFDLATFLRLGDELEQATQQTAALISQGRAIQKELASLGNFNWDSAVPQITALGNIVHSGDAVAYSSKTVADDFNQKFPGYKAPANYSTQYTSIVNSTTDTLNQILQSMHSSADNFTNEDSRLKFLQGQSQNAVGQTQVIQAASQIASEEVSQLQLLHQTQIAQTNAQTVFYAAQIQKDASARAEMGNIIAAGDRNTTGVLNNHPINDPVFAK